MNNENEEMAGMTTGPTVPLENTNNGAMFQSAGGPGRVLPTDAVYREGGGAAPTLATELQPTPQSITVPSQSPANESASREMPQPDAPKARVSAVDPRVPKMQANPNVELKPIHLTDGPDFDQEEEYEELEEYDTRVKTEIELELEKRNVTGLRFIIIFGLIILLFILLLPFISTLF